MSLKHAILVLLESEEGSGYDIVKSFNQGLGYFWNASHQQVYQELKKLHGQGWVDFEVQSQAGRPDKKVYQITTVGREELRAWLEQPAKLPKINDALLVKIYAGAMNELPALLAEIKSQREHYEAMLNEFLAIEQRYQAGSEHEQRQWKMPYLTLRRGIYSLRAWLQWADEVLAELDPSWIRADFNRL